MNSATHVPRRVLVTGGCGFIGTHLVRYLLGTDPSLRVVNLDLLTYAGDRTNLADLERDNGDRYRFVHGDITDEIMVGDIFATEAIDTVIHLAAESHVDRSIDAPDQFLRTNIWGTYNLLQAARRAWGSRRDVRFHHVSTDEVFGSLGEQGYFTEESRYDPSSPYSSSKAASDHLVCAWQRTFGLPVTLSNCSNNYGPYQYPEKLIPLMITTALALRPLPVYGDGLQVRDWLYVEDHCRAIDLIVRGAKAGATYVVGGRNEIVNLEMVRALCALLDEMEPRPDGGSYASLITQVVDRPGHDRRYAIDPARLMHDLGWMPRETISTGLRATVAWYLRHRGWVDEKSRPKVTPPSGHRSSV
ncbi:MAG: dTDP-glucose 4,6-dehydratase [Planctomycetes bacterium]|nr:dTDP-glucose 4,6-dehydratase [Planctomycetota bacterium]